MFDMYSAFAGLVHVDVYEDVLQSSLNVLRHNVAHVVLRHNVAHVLGLHAVFRVASMY